jgi:hypothetical protein
MTNMPKPFQISLGRMLAVVVLLSASAWFASLAVGLGLSDLLITEAMAAALTTLGAGIGLLFGIEFLRPVATVILVAPLLLALLATLRNWLG